MTVLRPETQYATLAQQGEAAQLGMWAFLATEVLFFGGLIFTYFIYRAAYPADFANAARDTELWCGSVNAALLVTSSLSMVLAIEAAAMGRQRAVLFWLGITAVLGIAFLAIKGYEYAADYRHQLVPALNFLLKPGYRPPGELFWIFYFTATGLHAIHLTIGVALVLLMLVRARIGTIGPLYYAPLEVVGLYWSFVDIVWLFLFPALYLPGRG
jgi:cytochrome c oxidase subunit 3